MQVSLGNKKGLGKQANDTCIGKIRSKIISSTVYSYYTFNLLVLSL